MSNQYLPKFKTEKAYLPCQSVTGAYGDKLSISPIINPHISYSEWEHIDNDFVVFKNVLLLISLEEVVYAELQSCEKSEIPNGATILGSHVKRVPIVDPPSNTATSTPNVSTTPLTREMMLEINDLAQMYRVSQNITYEVAVRHATDAIKKKHNVGVATIKQPTPAAVATAATTTATVKYKDVDMVEVSVSKIVGPFNRGAKFDVMLYNTFAKEGILHRQHSDKYYTLKFYEDGKRPPTLLKECVKQKAPQYFN